MHHDNARESSEATAALAVENLEKIYDDGTQALRGLDLRVPAGSFFGLVGPNGFGTTTLIGMVTGRYRPSCVSAVRTIVRLPTAGRWA